MVCLGFFSRSCHLIYCLQRSWHCVNRDFVRFGTIWSLRMLCKQKTITWELCHCLLHFHQWLLTNPWSDFDWIFFWRVVKWHLLTFFRAENNRWYFTYISFHRWMWLKISIVLPLSTGELFKCFTSSYLSQNVFLLPRVDWHELLIIIFYLSFCITVKQC